GRDPPPNRATVATLFGARTTPGDPSADPEVTELPHRPSISVIKSQTTATGGLGDLITYDIVVTNTGNTTVSNIEITDANAVITEIGRASCRERGDSARAAARREKTRPAIAAGDAGHTGT